MRKLTILVGGMIAAVPYQGGWTWAVLQYLLGLRQLGHNVYFVEEIQQKSLVPAGSSLENSVNAAFFRQVISTFGLERNATLRLDGTSWSIGLPYEDLKRAANRADVLVNVSGNLANDSLTAQIPVRIYLDLDPGFTQLWHAIEHINLHFAGHTHFVTVGPAIGQPSCDLPTCGLTWIPTVPPVVLNCWPPAERISYDALTTIANWRGYGSVEHQGVFYGQKAHSLRQFITLPGVTGEKFLLALTIHQEERADLAALSDNGWQLLDPATVASTPELYQTFVQESMAEFGIAKSGYVLGRSGWFSDRSVCFLASGRPVIAQDTGFRSFLPTGEGLFAFQTQDDVVTAIEAIRSDYPRHSRAARLVAEQHFDSDIVLPALLRGVGVSE